MLREMTEIKINEFLKQEYSKGAQVTIFSKPALGSITMTDVVIKVSKMTRKPSPGVVGCMDINVAILQEFNNNNPAIISFKEFCQGVVDKFIKNKDDEQRQDKIDLDIEFIVQGMPPFSSTFHSFFGFDPARSEKSNQSDLLEAVEPLSELLKKATQEGRNNQLILSSIQLELLAAQAGADNFSKDDVIRSLETIASGYTEQANKSRTENK